MLLVLTAGGCGGARPSDRAEIAAPPGGRELYGRDTLGLWAPLTPFEAQALAAADRARAGDARALLDLALVISADVRGSTKAQRLARQVEDFVAAVRPRVRAAAEPREGAARLFAAMRSKLLRTGDGESGGYEVDQTRLSEVLRSGRYNCLSSSLLFTILARYLGFDVDGVILPSHVFVQLRLAGGRVVEVETTAATGFDLVHDAAFYQESAADFAQTRGFEPTTFADYQRREIVSPLHLIATSAIAQHAHPGVLPAADRLRLVEMMGHLLPADRDAQIQRLGVYSAEYNALDDRGDLATARRLFTVVEPTIADIARRFPDDTEVAGEVAWAWYMGANTWLANGDPAAALEWVDRSLAALPAAGTQRDAVLANNLIVVTGILRGLAEAGRFPAGAQLLERYADRCAEVDSCQQSAVVFYDRWASHHWQRKEWPAAIARLQQALGHARRAEARATVLGNLADAFFNWSIGFSNAGDRRRAIEILERCVAEVPAAGKCRDQLGELGRRPTSCRDAAYPSPSAAAPGQARRQWTGIAASSARPSR